MRAACAQSRAALPGSSPGVGGSRIPGRAPAPKMAAEGGPRGARGPRPARAVRATRGPRARRRLDWRRLQWDC